VSKLDCNLASSGSACTTTVSSGGNTNVTVASGVPAQIQTPSGGTLSVTLPTGVSGTITFTDTNSGNSPSTIGFLGSIINISPTGGVTCSGGCTISFTFTGAEATAAGITPSQAAIYHDSNENGSFETSERLTTTVTGSDPYTATASSSFTSKFAVGGVRANVVAAARSLGWGGGVFELLSRCDPDGFASGQSLKVYEISYDKCTSNKLQVLAYSTCGPAKVEVTTGNGRYTLGIPSTQPFLNDEEKKIVFGAEIDSELKSLNILIKDKRDHFTDKIFLDQCNATKLYSRQTEYTSQQQSPFFYGSYDNIEQIPQSTQNIVDPEPTQLITQNIVDPEPTQLITQNIVDPEPTQLITQNIVDPEPTQLITQNTVDPEPTQLITQNTVDPEPTQLITQNTVDPEPTQLITQNIVDPEPIDEKPKSGLLDMLIKTFSKIFRR
jgi:hypothetical protein